MLYRRRNKVRCWYVSSVIAAVISSLQPSSAQTQSDGTPPRNDSRSENGVSFSTGAFSYDEDDLSIGGGDAKFSLSRSYTSSIADNLTREIGSQGWTLSSDASITAKKINNYITQGFSYAKGKEPYVYNVIVGSKSVAFLGGSSNPTGGFIGTYRPAVSGGERLVFSGTELDGHFTFTDTDGTVIYFSSRSQSPALRIISATYPNGTVHTYNYVSGSLVSIVSSRGYAAVFEIGGGSAGTGWTKACVINTAVIPLSGSSQCPASAASVTYNYATTAGVRLLASVVKPEADNTYYTYNGRNHLSCIAKSFGGPCLISNTYNTCRRDPSLQTDPPGLIWMDQVIAQQKPDGRTFSYSFEANPVCPNPLGYRQQTSVTSQVGTKQVTLNDTGSALSVTDELGRTTSMTYTGGRSVLGEGFLMESISQPEGDKQTFGYDARGNRQSVNFASKPSAGQGSYATSSVFPSSCVDVKICNKPSSVTDGRGAVTDYTYSSDHGGVLTEVSPADAAGLRAVKRYAYQQRYAWLANAAGGYSRAASPIWIPSSVKTCRTTVTQGDGCAGGAADEVVTAFEYGPDDGSTGNNLWLRGEAVTADGVTRRTCYGYDALGNRIWETKPRAGLVSCS